MTLDKASTCCGKSAECICDACTCDKASDGSYNPSEHETDFTTRR
ncbi:hypothetical protein CSHISOI_05913 [Colletotrichum shisoi]|uniref:Uncharacterized protein n=1 Tax=Colletotrichum shisoi TaxID=2078593 RepID=A0A5Q4BRB7_9PEZI|nr:hypothetical protein CSHISOI_05913 [Colletotrichum shisoi]